MRKISILALFILSLGSIVEAQTIPRPRGLVNDFAEVISPAVEGSISRTLESFNDQTGIEIAVVTVPSLQGYDIEGFTITLATAWGVGQRQKDNGIVILLAPNERQVRIEVGYGLEGDLTDGRTGQILDQNAIPSFKNKNWAEGLLNTVDGLVAHLGNKTFQSRMAERAEQERVSEETRVQNEANLREERLRQQKRSDEMKATIAEVLPFVVAVIAVLAICLLFYLRQKKVTRLKALQMENESKLIDVKKDFDSLKIEAIKAEAEFKKLDDVNIDSVREKYTKNIDWLKEFVKNTSDTTIPNLEVDQGSYKRALSVISSIKTLDEHLKIASQGANEIIALPKTIEMKKDKVISGLEEAEKYFKEADEKFKEVISRLNNDYRQKVASNSRSSNYKLSRLKNGLDFKNPDWILLSELLSEINSANRSILGDIDEYFGLVQRAKSQRSENLADLESNLTATKKVIDRSDVEESTKLEWSQVIIEADRVRAMKPKDDQSWVHFQDEITGTIIEIKKIRAKAIRDVEEAEVVRQRARRARRSASISTSGGGGGYRSSGGGSGGFGGGRFGGGGASRRF
jgi:uncharacterized protein